MEEAGIQIFGEVDRHPITHKIMSEYPAYMFAPNIDDLEQEIYSLDLALKNGNIDPINLGSAREELKTKKEKLEKIESSFPRFSDNEKDRVNKAKSDAAKHIRDAMFSHSAMNLGTAEAHEEARRMMSEDLITLHDGDLAQRCNISGTVTKGGTFRTSRTGAETYWKILSGALGESTNTEILRKR